MATRIETRSIGERSFDVIVAEIGDAVAEIWPALGGNCVRWTHPQAGDILYAPPMDQMIERPTRGGIPILFPFPNRIRNGDFTWAGREYHLPKNDSAGKNAIHGFAPRSAFRIHAHNSDTNGCNICLRQRGRDVVEDIHSSWPADWLLEWYWMLKPNALNVSVVLKNVDDRPLPFGLGLHPYLRLSSPNDYFSVPAAARWELHDSLPTGRLLPVTSKDDLRSPQRVSSLTLDDIYTQVDSMENQGMRSLGRLERNDQWIIDVKATTHFREVVVFTPPHRQAICIEPYTCPTDAVNLQNQSLDAGWQVLDPGQIWTAGVSMELSRSA